MNSNNLKLHKLNHHNTKEEMKTQFKFYCEYCDYGVFIKNTYKDHVE